MPFTLYDLQQPEKTRKIRFFVEARCSQRRKQKGREELPAYYPSLNLLQSFLETNFQLPGRSLYEYNQGLSVRLFTKKVRNFAAYPQPYLHLLLDQ